MSTLQELVSALGPDLVRVATSPAGLDISFTRAVVFDALDTPTFRPEDLVLAVGVPTESTFALRLIQGRPAAVLLRSDEPVDERLTAEAGACGVALLTVPTSCTWSQLHELVLSLPSRHRSSEDPSLTGTELLQDLFAIANALAARVAAPVTIEDTQSRLLAYSASHEGADAARSATILGHRVPDAYRKEVRRLGIAKRLLTETEPFHLVSALPEVTNRMVVAVRARDEVLGSVWALADEPFDSSRAAAFKEAASAIAVRLLHHRLTADLHRQQQSATLARLLEGGDAALDIARRAGITDEVFRLAAVAGRATAEPELVERCWTALSMQLSLSSSPAIAARVGDALYCLLPAPGARSSVETLRQGLDRASRDRLVIGLSGECSLSQLPAARDETDRVVQVLRAGDRGIAELEEVGLQVTMLRLAELEAARGAGGSTVLDEIAEYDTKHATSYYKTLSVHLSAFGDPTVASRALDVHTNTLRYRVKRLSEIFDLDLADEDVRFALMLALRLR